jgi:hypothetical protein
VGCCPDFALVPSTLNNTPTIENTSNGNRSLVLGQTFFHPRAEMPLLWWGASAVKRAVRTPYNVAVNSAFSSSARQCSTIRRSSVPIQLHVRRENSGVGNEFLSNRRCNNLADLGSPRRLSEAGLLCTPPYFPQTSYASFRSHGLRRKHRRDAMPRGPRQGPNVAILHCSPPTHTRALAICSSRNINRRLIS